MNTSIVYVLTSSPSDFFYEQTLISVWSAKYWNPDMKIIILVDDLTDASLIGDRSKILELVDEKIAIDLTTGAPKQYTLKERSRILKTKMRSYISGDIFYIDSDTVVCGSLAEIDTFQFAVGAVDDNHCPFKQANSYEPVLHYDSIIGYDVSSSNDYFNSGAMYMKDTPEVHAFTEEWYLQYLKGLSKGLVNDQPVLLIVDNKKHLITRLDGIYNCQILNGGLPFLSEAKVLHYYNVFGTRSFFALADPAFHKKIKDAGTLDEEDKAKIISAKRQFIGEYVLVYGNSLPYWKSSLRHLYLDSPKLFRLCELFSKILRKLSR